MNKINFKVANCYSLCIPSVTVDQLNRAYFKIKVEIDFCVQFVSTDTDRNIWFYNIIGEVF